MLPVAGKGLHVSFSNLRGEKRQSKLTKPYTSGMYLIVKLNIPSLDNHGKVQQKCFEPNCLLFYHHHYCLSRQCCFRWHLPILSCGCYVPYWQHLATMSISCRSHLDIVRPNTIKCDLTCNNFMIEYIVRHNNCGSYNSRSRPLYNMYGCCQLQDMRDLYE